MKAITAAVLLAVASVASAGRVLQQSTGKETWTEAGMGGMCSATCAAREGARLAIQPATPDWSAAGVLRKLGGVAETGGIFYSSRSSWLRERVDCPRGAEPARLG